MDEQDERRIRNLVECRDEEGLIVALTDKNMDVEEEGDRSSRQHLL